MIILGRKKSNFTPKPGRNVWLDTYIEVVKEDILKGLKQRKTMNLTNKEEIALQDILKDNSIIIRPADKGSGIVIVDSDQYFQNLANEVENNETYLETDEDTTKTIMKRLKNLVQRMYNEGTITAEMKNYLIPKYPHAAVVKGNPKIHIEPLSME